jgi:hypothetical protein
MIKSILQPLEPLLTLQDLNQNIFLTNKTKKLKLNQFCRAMIRDLVYELNLMDFEKFIVMSIQCMERSIVTYILRIKYKEPMKNNVIHLYIHPYPFYS